MISSGMIDLKTYLTYAGVTTELQHSPDGWSDESIKWRRDMKFHGLFREFTMPLQFVLDGAEIIRRAFYNDGLAAEVIITVEKRNRVTNQFEEKYVGVLAMETFKDTKDYCEVMCVEGGLSADVIQKMDTVFDIPFSYSADRHGAVVSFQGQVSNFETFTWVSPIQREDDEVTNPPADPTVATRTFTIDFDENDFKDINDGTLHLANYKIDPGYTWGIVIDRDCELVFDIIPGSRSYAIKSDGVLAAITYKEELIVERGGIETVLRVIVTDTQLVPADASWYEYFPGNNTEQRFPTTAGTTHQFLAGDKITFRVTITAGGSPVNYFARFINSGYYTTRVHIFDRLSAISLLAWKPKDLFEDIVKMIGADYKVKSDFLESRPTLVIPSESCRENLNGPALTHTSLAQFFNSFFVTEEIGMGVEVINGEDTLVIERLDYFYNTSTVHDIGTVKDFELTPTIDLLCSEIEIGFQKVSFQDYFGKQQFSGSSVWTTPIKRIEKKELWISPYRGDILGIDQIRIKQLTITQNTSTATETKDTEEDLANFLLDCNFDYTSGIIDYYQVNRDYTVLGVAYPLTVGNVRFTPRRCLLRHNHFLGSILHLMASDQLTHASGTNYYNFYSQAPGEPSLIIEKEPVDISLLTNAVFKPYYITFTAPAYFEMIDAADGNRYGMMKFNYLGIDYYGFIAEISATLAKDHSSSFKLLCAASTDLTNLIR